MAQRQSGVQRRGQRDAPRAQEGDLGSLSGSEGGAVVPTEAQETGTKSPRIRRTTGTRKGLCVPLGSLGSSSPGLPGPAGPGPLQAQLQASCLPQASHPGLPGKAPSRSPASAPRRPQLRAASEPSGPARRRPLRPDAPLGSLRPRPPRPRSRPPGLFQARPVNNTRTCRACCHRDPGYFKGTRGEEGRLPREEGLGAGS